MSGFTVVPTQLYAAAGAMADAARGGRAELSGLGYAARDLFDGGWVGAASSAFEGGWLRWHVGAEQVLSVLAEISSALARCADGYATGEQASCDAVRCVR